MVIFDDAHFGGAIADAAGVPFNPQVDRVIARVRGGELLGGVIFNGYTGASIGLHMAGFDPHWVNRDLLWVVFNYSFVQLGCKVVFGQVPETNVKALEADKRLGFKEVTRVEDVFPDGALIVLAMRREDCRWLNIKPRHLKEPEGYG